MSEPSSPETNDADEAAKPGERGAAARAGIVDQQDAVAAEIRAQSERPEAGDAASGAGNSSSPPA